MSYKKSLIKILEPILLGMVFPVKVFKTVVTGSTGGVNTIDIYVCDVFHAQVGFSITIGPNSFEIISVDDALNIITVTGTATITAPLCFHLYEPYFFHGTPRETNTEIVQQKDAFSKTPMFWLMETYTETFHDDPEDSHERDSDIRFFFLTQSSFAKQTEALHQDYLEPMKRLMQNFIEVYNAQRDIFEKWDFDYKVIPHTKFGVYINNLGYKAALFADQLSGIEVQATLKILKKDQCGCRGEEVYFTDESGILFIGEDNQLLIME